MIRLAISLSVLLTVSLIACNGHPSLLEARPETKLIGKWEAVSLPKKRGPQVQFEFLADGTLIENEKTLTQWWKQQGTGTYKFIDANHVKIELQPSWFYGAVIYEVIWPDKDHDHVVLRAADEVIPMVRVKEQARP